MLDRKALIDHLKKENNCSDQVAEKMAAEYINEKVESSELSLRILWVNVVNAIIVLAIVVTGLWALYRLITAGAG